LSEIVGNVVAPDGSEQKIKLLGDGQQVVVFGVHPNIGKPYSWHGGPGAVGWEDLPCVTAADAAERSIIRRVGVLTAELEHLEVRFATAAVDDAEGLDLYQRTANSLRRLLEAVGLKRRPRDVTPSIAEYLYHIGREPRHGPGVPRPARASIHDL
jgi:hypothetical protein